MSGAGQANFLSMGSSAGSTCMCGVRWLAKGACQCQYSLAKAGEADPQATHGDKVQRGAGGQ